MAMEYNIISLCDKHSTMFAPKKKMYTSLYGQYTSKEICDNDEQEVLGVLFIQKPLRISADWGIVPRNHKF